MSRLLAVASILALVAACTPQNASITDGSYSTFLSTSSSPTIFKDVLKLSGDGVDPSGFDARLQIDCRDPDDVVTLPGADLSKCPPLEDVRHEKWMQYDGFEVLTSSLAENIWRGEAIVTSEGDLQLTFHSRLPGAQDFRFAIVVDPQFQPSECALQDDGTSARVAIDGDWLANWSEDVADEGGGTMFYLNAGAYQFNPANIDQVWVLPNKWLAGTAKAKFAEEDFNLRAPRYGYPSAYASYELGTEQPDAGDLFYVDEPPGSPGYDAAYDEVIDDVQGVIDETVTEFASVANVSVSPRYHDNKWRPADDSAPGLDSWVELDYNWVRFDQQAANLSVGEPASGDFFLILEAGESQSKIVVQGSFEVDKIKADRWTVPDLNAEKLAESGALLCGESAATE